MKRRASAVIGSLVFLLIAPGTVAGLVPWWISRWRMQPSLLGWSAVPWIGVALILAGVAIVVEAFARFAWQGLGTPAPVFPTQRLVVTGLYRHVRNPIYIAVFTIILGQALFFGNIRLAAYGVAVWLAFHLFVLAYEEPTLHRAYGDEYEAFRATVPRWIPRLRPFRPTRRQAGQPNALGKRRRLR
jgi:protein-S-isoprenylcysteine O-methyltransferase Ste14